MGTEAALLADIFEHPDDDTPRLVYADWLTDHGNPGRGEFIRAQVAAPGSEREEELLLVHEGAWRAELPDLPGVRWGEFRRGFVDAIEVDTIQAFLSSARRIFAAAPVRSVWVLQAEDEDADEEDEGVEALARSRYLTRLTRLDLMSAEVGDDAVLALVCRQPSIDG